MRRPEEHSNREDNAWGKRKAWTSCSSTERAGVGTGVIWELGGELPCPSGAGLSVKEDDSPPRRGARKWALRGAPFSCCKRLNRTLSKKVNRARGEPVKHCENRRGGEKSRAGPGPPRDTGASGVGALGRAAIVANDAPRALTS